MNKKLLFFIVAFIILISAGIMIFFQINNSLHKTISLEDISDIEVYGKDIKASKVDDPILIKNIAEWFDKATDIRLNKDFAGTTSESGIIINLKSGKRILILKSGKDFEIQRDDVKAENISYWAKQDDLKKMLEQLAATKVMPGLNLDKLINRDISFTDFEKHANLKLIREATYISKKGQGKYYEYNCLMPLEDIKRWITNEVQDDYGKIIKDLDPPDSSSKENYINMKIELPGTGKKRFLYIFSPKYLDQQHLVVIETTYEQGQEINEIHEGEAMLVFIPMNDGTVKEVLLSDYFHEHSDGYFLASYVLKAYNDELHREEGAIKSEITGEEALLFEVTPLKPFNGWRIKLPENKLPNNPEKRKLYLYSLAHSLLVGFKNTSSIIPWQEVIFEFDNLEAVKYSLKDFEGKF